ncbi:MAG: hypothetical protein IJT41_09900 [Clostridia bacterium]|nr:hypothetical protein [Clostridia bacterium]
MKRFFIPVILICLTFCGCGRNGALHRDALPQWPAAMHAELSVQIDGSSFAADWTYDGTSAFSLLKPQDLCGVTVYCEGAQSHIESDGVQAQLPQQSVFIRLDGAYRALANGLAEPQRTQEGWLYDGMDRYGFEALAPAEGGSLQIRFPKEKAEASFTVTAVESNIESS